MNTENNPTRRQILRLLRLKGPLTPKALASDLGVTTVAVRKHMDALEHDGLVATDLLRQPKGRPAFAYRLTEQGLESFPRNYDALTNQLLEAVRVTQGEGQVNTLFKARMDQLYEQYRPRMEGKNLQERVAELARIQDEAGYMATFEPRGKDFLLHEQNCAIFRVACRFQQACDHELLLFRKLLGARVQRLEHQVQGDRFCTYLIQEK